MDIFYKYKIDCSGGSLVIFYLPVSTCSDSAYYYSYTHNSNSKMGGKESKKLDSELDEATIQRLTNNTNYTPEQIQQWHQAFLRDCPSGKLSDRQFTEVYKKFYPEHEAEKYSNQVFRTFDIDNNGYIDFVEFLLAVNINSNGDVREKLGLAFDIYDINSDEKVRGMKQNLFIM
ncbi:unnamed protein product [Didymodactylos carnosus]|uniref:EF-hand domain-containing protein n=1 Tax=Didymodactylos carnosus TaxID=1234261 RepID=A0A8S2S6C2_9BILA|nr:unnamed protein product [Didymodactylos carnosus]CAF4205904.1 unnamed protein product [Didymodactylos carnosus]